jgi:eukaryotic-like serine/threonine-protein kinase
MRLESCQTAAGDLAPEGGLKKGCSTMASTTTMYPASGTQAAGGNAPAVRCPEEILERYRRLVRGRRFSWTEHYHFTRLLGEGGQGVVYLADRRGADSFTLPVAVKVFSPERYADVKSYGGAMANIAQVAARVAQIQQDNLLDVYNFVDRNRIRLMEMEWIDGFDLHQLLTSAMLERARQRTDPHRWAHINDVIVTAGPVQPRLKPGIAIAIVRDCLAALAALHRNGIIHGDMKPSNIMLKRTGNAKIVDIGSAFALDNPPMVRTCTPAYAAPEVLEGGICTPRSDLASLGYVLIEMLSGVPCFAHQRSYRDLLEAKRFLAQRLAQILPREVVVNQLLMNFCCGLIAPDPTRRFPSAEAADMLQEGAASFHRQLVKSDLASEYDNEIRLWLKELD